MENKPARNLGSDQAMIFVVTSGKGGVGKTSLSVNLCSELASRGRRVILVDGDLGLANAHILMGIKPTKSLTDYLEGRAQVTEILSDCPNGLKLISGGQGMQEMANLDSEGRKRITDAIIDLKSYCDLIVVDTGAGVSNAVTDFVHIADHTIVVTNANFAAIANAYGIIKVIVSNGYSSPLHLLVNRARSTSEAKEVFSKLQGCTRKFLDFDLGFLGLIPEDIKVTNAVQKRTPFTQAFPESISTDYLKKVVVQLEALMGTGVGS